MSTLINMDEDIFTQWTQALKDAGYHWEARGIANSHCNQISEPMFGVRIVNWPERRFEIIDEQKYVMFLLRLSQ